MKFKKTLSLLLSAVMVMGSATFAASAAPVQSEDVGAYYNQNTLETEAKAALSDSSLKLGSTYSQSSTTWQTWSPNATAVKVRLYRTGSDNEAGAGFISEHAMSKNSSTGVWSLTLTGDYKNVYYTYQVTVNGTTKETQDVYSKAVGVNGNRSMVVDLDSTDPDGWENDKHVLFNNAGEAVVWEVHVRDFSIASNSGVSEENKGKYLAFAEGGTKLNGNASSISTGIDYLVEQGVNCVQLQPIYDFGSVNETVASSSTNRNWGYDPVNYNVPEGSYSSNPYDGNVRIKEFKMLVQALHDRGISVVMDVVYNHTYSTDSCFERTAPGYYYRMTGSNIFRNGSGCGNETASDKAMYRQFMIDSLKYWADEYHIDGFRFDLMGLHDRTTMNAIRSALNTSITNGSKILMYGEPWCGDGGTAPVSDPVTKGSLTSLDNGVGIFSDDYRDAIKGNTDGTGTTGNNIGFVQGDDTKTGTIISGVKGKCFATKAPSQVVSYADAHDNLILWDKLALTNGKSVTSTDTTVQNQAKMVMSLLLTSQGIPFMTAGSEFGRTKQGDKNSYKSSDTVNQIDWSRISSMPTLAQWYKTLLALRKNYTPLHSASFVTPTAQSDYGHVAAYTYSNSTAGEWGKVCVLMNNDKSSAYSISLEASSWTVVANSVAGATISKTGADIKGLQTINTSSVSVPPQGAIVLVQNLANKTVADTFGTLNVKHVDESGNVLKTQTVKYRVGNTYRAIPDSTLLFSRKLVKTDGATSGTVTANGNYTVTFTYSNDAIKDGYLTINYVDSTGNSIKETAKTHLRDGDAYQAPVVAIQGYELDTNKFPAGTSGTFTGDDITINFVYKPLATTTTTVHYYNSNNWKNVRCYAYTDDGDVGGLTWDKATIMTDDTSMGTGWLKATINAPMAYIMFHPASSTGQEPGQGEQGYLCAGEAWIQNKVVTFSSTVITSHIDLATGQKVAPDVTNAVSKITSNDSYTTSPLSGRTDYVTPVNAKGNYQAGIINVVYLYTNGDIPVITTAPVTTEEPTPGPDDVLIGDVNGDGYINIKDATFLQRVLAEYETLTLKQQVAADCDRSGKITVKDVTLIQKYVAEISDKSEVGHVGTYTSDQKPTQPETTAPVTQPTTTQPSTTQPVGDSVTLNAAATTTGDEVWYAWTWDTGLEGSWVYGGTGSTVVFKGLRSNVIFARVNPALGEPNWDTEESVWNQTEDLLTQYGGTYTITGWGEGYGAKLTGSWSGGEIPPNPPQPTTPSGGGDSVTLNAAATTTGDEVWYAYTWDTGSTGSWIYGGTGSTIIFTGLKGNVLFARVNPSMEPNWDNSESVYNQTEDLVTQYGGTYTITGWGDGYGAKLTGSW